MNEQNLKSLRRILEILEIDDLKLHLEKFELYHRLLLEWNKKTNLISKADEARIVERHFAESLSIFLAMEFPFSGKMLDIGSGAGFPGLPIAILRQNLSTVLLDSKRLKILFLREVIEKLNLKNVDAVVGRAENLVKENEPENKFDIVVSRAVGPLVQIYSWARPLMAKNGIFIAWKGGDLRDEIDDLEKKLKTQRIAIKKMDEKIVEPTRDRCFVIIT